MPQDRWDTLTVYGKAWWQKMIDKLGSYDAVIEWRKEASSGRLTSRLSDEQIEDIRHGSKTNRQLADEYGISPSYASKIRNRRRL